VHARAADRRLGRGPGWGLCNFQELFGQSFTEMKSLTSLPIFISETDLAPLSTGKRHLFRACAIPWSPWCLS
jgi:hypothetical protein